jgi:cellulose synthase/poly-beta-1,6-N-acetylglucosamine synthase-like glycosyltransferase
MIQTLRFRKFLEQSRQTLRACVRTASNQRSTHLTFRYILIRILIVANLLFGLNYLIWRYFNSINWAAWPIAIGLILAETYSYVDAWLFELTVWRLRVRKEPPHPPRHANVDVFIKRYNEPVELVRRTLRAALSIQYPHETYVLDDGNSPEMLTVCQEEGAGYIVRSPDWQRKERHAKAGNLNNALLQSQGEFILILDADQIPYPLILHRTLGYFSNSKVAFVQTPQWFYNTPKNDPFGSDAPLFYGPIQQGKDAKNAAFFCGSNAVFRREALMQLGIVQYVRDLEVRTRQTLDASDRLLANAESRWRASTNVQVREAFWQLRHAIRQARASLRARAPIQEVVRKFQLQVRDLSHHIVRQDLAQIRADLAASPGIDAPDIDASISALMDDPAAMRRLAQDEVSPLAAIKNVCALVQAIDTDRSDQAQAIMPMPAISITEDMATAMRLHALGWESVFHSEILACGLAPEDLRAALRQRLRWAQGTIQVMLQDNPLFKSGLSLAQRLMYWATIWGYLSGFFSVIYLVAPILYLFFGMLPVQAYSLDFMLHLFPYLIVNQAVFVVAAWKIQTWRGQQYNLALFPIWIQAFGGAIANVYFGRRLSFIVTPKTRQKGTGLSLIWPQLVMIVVLFTAVIFGLTRLAFGATDQALAIVINIYWAVYDLIALSVILAAASYRPVTPGQAELTNLPSGGQVREPTAAGIV